MALPIHRLAPSSTHSSPSRRAVVSMPPATSEPPCGSVNAKAPIFSNRLIAGSHRRFCSSEPQVSMLPIARPLCTPKNTDSDGSACAISIAVIPVRRLLGADSDESGSAQSSRPSFAKPLTSSNGNSARAQYSSTTGETSERKKSRMRSIFARSESESSSS